MPSRQARSITSSNFLTSLPSSSCVFAYNKNFQELQVAPADETISKNRSEFVDNIESPSRYKVFTFDYLVKRLIDYGEEQGHNRVR